MITYNYTKNNSFVCCFEDMSIEEQKMVQDIIALSKKSAQKIESISSDDEIARATLEKWKKVTAMRDAAAATKSDGYFRTLTDEELADLPFDKPVELTTEDLLGLEDMASNF